MKWRPLWQQAGKKHIVSHTREDKQNAHIIIYPEPLSISMTKKAMAFFYFRHSIATVKKASKKYYLCFPKKMPPTENSQNLIKATFEVFQFEIKNQDFLRVLCLNFYQVYWGILISFKVKEATNQVEGTRNHRSVFQWLCHTTPCSMSPLKRPHFPTPLNISSISLVSTQSSLFGF